MYTPYTNKVTRIYKLQTEQPPYLSTWTSSETRVAWKRLDAWVNFSAMKKIVFFLPPFVNKGNWDRWISQTEFEGPIR